MNHREGQQSLHTTEQTYYQPEIQKLITSLGLLLLAYYVFPYIAYETTIKRSLYEFVLNLIPLRFINLIQSLILRLRPEDSLNFHHNLSSTDAKGQALSQIYHGTGIPAVVKKARRLSGYDKIMSPITEDLYRGLNNWDNSCFQNSIIQALACLPFFVEYLMRSLQYCEMAGTGAEVHYDLASFLDRLNQLVNRKTAVWPPATLKSLDTWQQQDAQEYFSKILDTLDKESNRCWKILAKRFSIGLSSLRDPTLSGAKAQPEGDESMAISKQILSQIIPLNPIEGMLAQTLRCETCGFSEGFSLMPFNCITLNLGLEHVGQLDDLLDAYTAPELIDGVECDGCSQTAGPDSGEEAEDLHSHTTSSEVKKENEKQPKIRSTKAKQITFGRLPKDLVFHINRSIFDAFGNQRKNTAPISFPARLQFNHEWIAPISKGSNSEEPVFELRCVVTHSGRHDNGHYVACGKRGKDWYTFNDEIVTKSAEEFALARSNVFMLFYEKIEAGLTLDISPHASTAQISGGDVLENPGGIEEERVA